MGPANKKRKTKNPHRFAPKPSQLFHPPTPLQTLKDQLKNQLLFDPFGYEEQEEREETPEKTPRKRVRSKIPGPRRPRPPGFFKRMSNSRLVAYAQ